MNIKFRGGLLGLKILHGFLEVTAAQIIREVFVKLLLDSFGKLSIRVGVRTYLLGGAIDGSEANRIIHDPKLELESSRFTFDLLPLCYESVDVIVGENWLLRHKAEMVCHEKVVKMPWQEVWDDCKSCKVRVGSNGNLLWEAFVLLGRKKDGMRNGHVEVYGYAFWVNRCTSGFHGVNEPGGEDVRKVFQQRGSGAKRKLSRCGRNQMGNEPILALPKGADDFVVYYDTRSKNLKACLEKRRSEFDFEAKYHLGKANVDVVSTTKGALGWGKQPGEGVCLAVINSREGWGLGVVVSPEKGAFVLCSRVNSSSGGGGVSVRAVGQPG
ncbi:hypothetical protein Tco_1054839 [Tanacetum coccineum]|uniref:Uncharacterized protein n=1 Tax=Tanacetum coccineum TaxID=301880 RepID=A0ABQ5GZZ2_9ASTR